jgi:hypothetical protein
MASKLGCARCGREALDGAAVVWSGPATGYNTERSVLCEECVGTLRMFMVPTPHVEASDPITTDGLAHIATCPICKARFGGYPLDVSSPVTINKQRVAERFARGGRAQ